MRSKIALPLALLALCPLRSQITIESQEALCCPDRDNKDKLCITYLGNVRMQLADGTALQAPTLTCCICHTQTPAIEKLHASGRVKITSGNRETEADEAYVDLAAQTCRLQGNVQVRQGGDEADFALSSASDTLVVNFAQKHLVSTGTPAQPVHTVIGVKGVGKKRKKS